MKLRNQVMPAEIHAVYHHPIKQIKQTTQIILIIELKLSGQLNRNSNVVLLQYLLLQVA